MEKNTMGFYKNQEQSKQDIKAKIILLEDRLTFLDNSEYNKIEEIEYQIQKLYKQLKKD